MSHDLAGTLLSKISEEGHHASAKVTVVGTGQVGMAAAFAMMTQVNQSVVAETALSLMTYVCVCE